ncbi:iron chelate uptake ABC transporter family permease subunit [Nonomuraea sp. PA05]|uniref:iron chelate uptake ABC transporter family permease subunit n=1 Tax=Nonomuraea sp. PA05 TaxID=2604466 RepID=UPI0011D84642|nr:iron chelate uptake ABC transporter family permease subunit [Nonomuraea sp. PA05]TYB57237.1 iron chelate uptake ABC transporter family permease subunit [Nonomuraea sp. PA05]
MSRPPRPVPLRLPALVTAALTLAACGQAPAPQPQAAAPRTGFPVTIENCGRELTFDQPPSKVVTGYHPSLETLLALGLGDRIAGRTFFGESAFLPGQKETYDKIPQIVREFRLPRALLALLVGAGLSVVGAVLQDCT